MSETDAAKRREYQKARYHADKEKGAARIRAWREANPDKAKAIAKSSYTRDPEARKEYMRKWREANPDKVASYYKPTGAPPRSDIAATPEEKAERGRKWRRENKERARELKNRWRKENRVKVKSREKTRELRKINAVPTWANLKAIDAIYAHCQDVCELTGEIYHVDHIVPLRSTLVCGLHVEFNLQVITAEENSAKSNLHWPDMP
jgi:plasmid stabilization system protein ParE